MKRVTLSFSDDDDLGVLQAALDLAITEWQEMFGEDDDSVKRADRIQSRVHRARWRLA